MSMMTSVAPYNMSLLAWKTETTPTIAFIRNKPHFLTLPDFFRSGRNIRWRANNMIDIEALKKRMFALNLFARIVTYETKTSSKQSM